MTGGFFGFKISYARTEFNGIIVSLPQFGQTKARLLKRQIE
jgi:hypothetical protein